MESIRPQNCDGTEAKCDLVEDSKRINRNALRAIFKARRAAGLSAWP